MDRTTVKKKRRMTFSEKGVTWIIGISYIFLAVIVFYGWLVLQLPDTGELVRVFGTIIGGGWLIFELKAKAENAIVLGKMDKDKLYQNQDYEEEEI